MLLNAPSSRARVQNWTIKATTNGGFLEEMLQIPFPNFLDIYIFLTEYLIKLITVYCSILNTIKYLRERENRIYFIIEIFVIAINNPFYECPKIKNLLIRKAKKIKEIRISIEF